MGERSKTVDNAFAILRHLSNQSEPISPGQLGDQLGMSPGSLYRLLNSLEHASAIRRLGCGRIALGDLAVELAASMDYNPRLREAALPSMRTLRDEFISGSVGLYMRLSTAEMTCITAIEGPVDFYRERLYRTIPIARGAVSLAYLASDYKRFGFEGVERYLRNLSPQVAPPNIDRTLQRIEMSARDGVASSLSVRIAGAAALASTIQGDTLGPVAVIALAGKSTEFSHGDIPYWRERLLETCSEIADRLKG